MPKSNKKMNPDDKRIAEEVERRLSEHLYEEVERRVSERLKELENKYSSSEEKYALAFQNSNAGMVLARLADGSVIEVNDQFLDMFGLDREDVLGKIIGPRVWKDPEQRQQMIDAIEQQGQFLAQEMPFLRQTGEEWIGLIEARRNVLQGEPVLIASIVDITDRILAREEALESKAKMETALESLNDAVLIADVEGNITDFNKSFATFHGFRDKDECARSVDEFAEILEAYLPDGNLAPVDQWVLPKALRGEKATNAEYTVRRKDSGTTWDGSYSFAPIRNRGGVIIGAVAVGRDITEQKRIKEELGRREKQYRAIFEQAAVGIGRVSLEDACWIDVNKTFSKMVGYTQEELRRIPWPQITHPDDLDLDLIPFREMAAGKLEDYIVEKRFIHKRGQHVWARLTLSLVRNAQGDPDYEIAIIEDINERKQMQDALRSSEERWNLALENIEAGVIIATEEAQVLYWNPAARNLHGLSSPDEGFSPLEETFDLWTPDRRHKLELDERPIRRIKRGETIHGYELRLHRPDQGWEKYISYSGSMVETAEGKKLIFLTLYDLTELRSRTEELVAVNRELEAFSYSVSHDLRTPLRAISGFSTILQENYSDKLDEEGKDILNRISDSTDRMASIIDDMLSLAKVSRESMNCQEIDLSTIAYSVVNDLRQSGPQRNTEITIAQEMPVFADLRFVSIALTNLIGNAWKYSGKNPRACIDIGVMKTEDEDVFFVRDNGSGFDMNLAHKLFKPFHRLHSDNQFSGTGIGLSITKKIIQRHNGKIWAETEIGKGSTFYFTLASRQGKGRR